MISIETFLIAGAVSFIFQEVKLPHCIIGAENKNYCISRQYANIKSEHIEFVKKLNASSNDTRLIIKLKNYGTVTIPYDPNKLIFEYQIKF